MKKVKNIIIIVVVLILMFFIVRAFLAQPNLMPVKGQLDELDLSEVNKLMIISHPGDESVWGGAHLLTDDYLVVCVSCGYDEDKTETFKQVMGYSNDEFVMMGYSDKIYLGRNYKQIKKEINLILSYKDWDMVVTHNPDGENDNYQHQQINNIINEIGVDNLYYFEEYYTDDELDQLDLETTLDEEVIQNKIKYMVNEYDDLYDDYKHILPFEEWIGASEWKS